MKTGAINYSKLLAAFAIGSIVFLAVPSMAASYQQDYQNSKSLQDNGDLNGAYEVAISAYQSALRDPSASEDLKGEIANHAGEIALEFEAGSIAISHFEQSIAHYNSAYGKDSLSHIDPLFGIAKAQLMGNSRSKIVRLLKALDRIVEIHLRAPSLKRYEIYMFRSRVQSALGDDHGARKFAKMAIDDGKGLANAELTGDGYMLMGLIEAQYRNYPTSVRYLEEAIAQYQTVFPEGHEKLLKCHSNIATAYIRGLMAERATPHLQYVGQYQNAVDRDNPEPIFRTRMDYPERERRKGIEGWVEIQFTITEEGRVQDPVVVKSEPPGIFDEAALKSIKSWRFAPRVVDGKALSSSHTNILSFGLIKHS